MRQLLLIVFVLVSLMGFAQNESNVYYSNTNTVMTPEKYESFKNKLSKKLKTQGMEVSFTVYKETLRNDSLIKFFKVSASLAGSNAPEVKHFSGLETGKPLPDLPLQQLKGDTMHLTELKGKPIVLNFWHTRCFPCIKEMPQLNQIKRDYADSVHFLAVTDDSPEKVNTFLEEHEFNFTHIVLADDFTDTCGILAVPKFFYIDKHGNFMESGRGIGFIKGEDGKLRMGSDDHIRGAIDDLLKE